MEDAHKVLAANRKVIFPLGYVYIYIYIYVNITDDPATQSAFDQMANSQARWRDRSSAALWIRRARPCACAWRTESHTLIGRRSAERRARRRAVQLRPQPILPSIFLHEPAYLHSSWQLDGLYTLSLILSLDLRLGAAAPSWCTLGASWAQLGRKKCLLRKIQKY